MGSILGQMLILFKGKNEITPMTTTINTSLEETRRRHDAVARQSEIGQKRTIASMRQSQAALRQLAQGVAFLGTTFIGLGSSMSQSNNQMTKSIGNTLLIAGSFMSAIGAAAQFISVIGRMVTVLKALNVQKMISLALTPGVGWAVLAGGAALGVGMYAGMSKMQSANKEVASSSRVQGVTNVYNIRGSVVTEREISDMVRRNTVQTQQRNNTSGIK